VDVQGAALCVGDLADVALEPLLRALVVVLAAELPLAGAQDNLVAHVVEFLQTFSVEFNAGTDAEIILFFQMRETHVKKIQDYTWEMLHCEYVHLFVFFFLSLSPFSTFQVKPGE
jgi:hypothetical protein